MITENSYPILFNSLKHHLNAIRSYIHNPPDNWLQDLEIIGNSLTDIYFGHLNIDNIFAEVWLYLKENRLDNYQAYYNCINHNKGYLLINLSDSSVWILRVSKNNMKNFVHIHPGRNTKFTVRIKSEWLKTAIAYKIMKIHKLNSHLSNLILNIDFPDTNIVNSIRKYLLLSPIKKLHPDNHFLKLIKLL